MNEFTRLRDHPIFICGHPKSGTTLLVSLLDSHPELVVYPAETVFFRGLLPRLRNLGFEEKLSLAKRYLLQYFEPPSSMNHPERAANSAASQEELRLAVYIQYGKTCEQMDSLLTADLYRHEGDFLSAAVLAFGLTHQKISPRSKYWVEKTPYNEYFAEQIFSWWPQARCIHVVRDPRDNYATYRRKHPNLSPERFSRGWNTSLGAALQNRSRYGAERYLVLRYEDLTSQPEEIVPQLVSFLGIQDDEILRTPTKNGLPWQGNSMFNERFSGISARPLGRWKSELNAADVSLIETACRSGMKRMDYPLQGKRSFSAVWRLVKFYGLLTLRLPADLAQTVRRHYGVMPLS